MDGETGFMTKGLRSHLASNPIQLARDQLRTQVWEPFSILSLTAQGGYQMQVLKGGAAVPFGMYRHARNDQQLLKASLQPCELGEERR